MLVCCSLFASAFRGASRATIVNRGALRFGTSVARFDAKKGQRRGYSNTRLNCVSSEELANALPDCKRRLGEVQVVIETNHGKAVLDLPGLRQQIKDMELESSQPEFWDDADEGKHKMYPMLKAISLDGWSVIGHWVVHYKALVSLYHPPHSQFHTIPYTC